MIAVTGANGYIGRNLMKLLVSQGCEVIGIDNFSTSRRDQGCKEFELEELDITETKELEDLFVQYKVESVIHLAGSAYVEESNTEPLKYFQNNTLATLGLTQIMRKLGIHKLVFASSCTVYAPSDQKLTESSTIGPASVYGMSKWLAEEAIKASTKDSSLRAIALRFFNVVGGQPDGSNCDNHNPETHLLPNLVNSAMEGKEFQINGNEFPTPDGTAQRDFTHVRDIATGIFLACRKLQFSEDGSFKCINLGSETSTSVLEVVRLVERELNISTLKRVNKPRPGDVPVAWADNSYAKQYLGWACSSTLSDAVKEQHMAWAFDNRDH